MYTGFFFYWLGKKGVLYGVQNCRTACGKVHPTLQVAGVRRTQRAIAGDFDGTALGKAAGSHDHLIRVARLIRRFRRGKTINGAVMLDTCAKPGKRRSTARIKAGHNVIMIFRVARHRMYPRQLQQTLGINGRFQCLTYNPGCIVKAQESVPQAAIYPPVGVMPPPGFLMKLPAIRSAPTASGSCVWVNSP